MAHRAALDRVIEAGGFITADTGGAPDANLIPIPKPVADAAMDAAAKGLIARYPAQLVARYRLDAASMQSMDGPDLVEAVGRRRGCLVKGGGLDLEKAAQILLQDYRDGALGRISLETPDTRAQMTAAAQAAAAQAAGGPDEVDVTGGAAGEDAADGGD